MSIIVEAMFDGKTFRPLETVQIEPNTKVMLTIREGESFISASEARRIASRFLLGDLVGTALSVNPPLWSENPKPHWQVSYSFFDGTLFTSISVDAHSAKVWLTDKERDALLVRLESMLGERYAVA